MATWLNDMSEGDEEVMDIFTFIKKNNFDLGMMNSDWFKELWYPMSKKQHILVSMLLLNWMGYDRCQRLK
jgi:hypothetical protein